MRNKLCSQQVLGSLMKKPLLMAEIDKYYLTPEDFSTKLDKLIFSAIFQLYQNGAAIIRPIDIETHYEQNESVKAFFEKKNGLEYIQDVFELAEEDNFSYYYNKMKKLNLLGDLKNAGFDISQFYCDDLADENYEKINQRFDEISSTEIIAEIKRKIVQLEGSYAHSDENEVVNAAEGLDDLIENLEEGYDLGLPIQGYIINEIIGGARLGTMTIRSGQSGIAKTRANVADACYLSYPIRFDNEKDCWIETGNAKKTVFVATEQKITEIQKMILAYLTDIEQSRFKRGRFTKEEKIKLSIAKEIMEKFNNLIIVRIPDPCISSIKALLRETCILNNAQYVFYDYIFSSPALFNEFKGNALRTDEALLLLSTALKDIAVELNIALFTSTQVNSKADNNTEIRNEASLAGARSIINKADNGMIMAHPTKEELELLNKEGVIEILGIEPNIVTDIYKVRDGRWSQVRVWSYFDKGRLKWEDLFLTDNRMQVLSDFVEPERNEIESFEDAEKVEIMNYCKRINGKAEND